MLSPSENHAFRHRFAPDSLEVSRLHIAKRCVLVPVVLSALVFFFCGCHKKSETAATPPATSAANSTPTGPVKALVPTSTALQDPTVRANLKTLNAYLYQYIARIHQMPRSFDAFVADSQIQVPPPPAGMRYVIYNASVTLGPQ